MADLIGRQWLPVEMRRFPEQLQASRSRISGDLGCQRLQTGVQANFGTGLERRRIGFHIGGQRFLAFND